jgi:hypothetical protein
MAAENAKYAKFRGSVHHEGHEEHEVRNKDIQNLRVIRDLRGEIEFSYLVVSIVLV